MTDSLQYNHGLFIGNSGNLRSMVVLLNHGSKTGGLLVEGIIFLTEGYFKNTQKFSFSSNVNVTKC